MQFSIQEGMVRLYYTTLQRTKCSLL